MAIQIDESFLADLGITDLPAAERTALLAHIYETLETRVGMRLAEAMSEQQLDEFERFIDTEDEAGALKWLETNFPSYPKVVAAELEKLKLEIRRDAHKLQDENQPAA